MPITVTISNNAGSPSIGAVATVAGSSGGTVTVFAVQVASQFANQTWASYGSRTGDGTVPLALGAGFWFVYAVEGSTLSAVVYAGVTTGLDAVGTRCRAAVLATIQLLGLPMRAYLEQFEEEQTNSNTPCIVSDLADGVKETDDAAMNNRDDIGHPVRVLILDRKGRFDNTDMAKYERWRQAIWRAFHNQRLAGVIESVICKVEPYAVAEHEKGKYQGLRVGLLIRCRTRELRGLGA